MKYSDRKKQVSTRTKKIVGLSIIALFLLGGGVFAFFHLGGEDNNAVEDRESPAASEDFRADSDRELPERNERQGTATDVQDEEESNTNRAEESQENNSSITSDSGKITVTSPAQNSNFRSGDVLTGTATVNRIHYRLIDNHMGVVVEGSSPVRDGKFSVKFEFDSAGNEGRLDVFTRADDGIEDDYVLIDLKLW